MSIPSPNVVIHMSDQTVESLTSSGYRLSIFRVVETNDSATLPVLWLSTGNYSVYTKLSLSDALRAYSSQDPIGQNMMITPGFDPPIKLGQILKITGTKGTGMIIGGEQSDVIEILNTTGTLFTVGLSAGSDAGAPPLCAAPLYGGDLKLLRPIDRALIIVSGTQAPAGTVLTQSRGAGVLVELGTAENRELYYDVQTAWSWGGFAWGTQVPAGTDLVGLVTIRSETLATAAQARLRAIRSA